jgi:hypothetical protein
MNVKRIAFGLATIFVLVTGCATTDSLPAGVPKGYAVFYSRNGAPPSSTYQTFIYEIEGESIQCIGKLFWWSAMSVCRIALEPGTHLLGARPPDVTGPGPVPQVQVLIEEGMVTPVRMVPHHITTFRPATFEMYLVAEDPVPLAGYEQWRNRVFIPPE